MKKQIVHQLKWTRAIRLVSMLSIASLLIIGCSSGGGKATADLGPRPVKTEAVQKRTISAPNEQVADIKAGTTWDVVAKANGEAVEVYKKRGDVVEKGEVLFVLDSVDAQSARRSSELALKNAELTLTQTKDGLVNNRKDLTDNLARVKVAQENAQKEYNKIRNQFDAGMATQHQVDMTKQSLDDANRSVESVQSKLDAFDRKDSVAAALSQVESARLGLENATRTLEHYSVKAPGSGVLTDFTVVVGQTVSAAAGRVGQIQQIDPIKIATELTESNYKLVKGKQELVYYHPDAPNETNKAKISYLAPIMSAATKTYTLELEIPNGELKIQPGTRYMVQLTTEAEEQVVAVPSMSVVREESSTYVFVLQGNQYQKRQVKLGRINGQYQEVLEGLKEGEQVVVTGQNTLKDGEQAVSANSAAPSSAPKS